MHAGEVSASSVMRVLRRGGNPTQLGDALAQLGRIFKTLHVLSYVDAEPYRRGIKRMRNLQEERHGLGSTSSTAAAASCGRPTTPGWRTSWARSGW